MISTSSVWTDPLLLGQERRLIFLSPVENGGSAFASLASAVSKQVRLPDPRQADLRDYHDELFGWPSIARRLVGEQVPQDCF